MRFFLLFVLFLMMVWPQWTNAQYIPIGDPFEEYTRFLFPEDGPSHNIRPISIIASQKSDIENRISHPWQHHPFFTRESNKLIGLYTPQLKTTWNSRFPSGQNDGALWQGRGLNTAISLGGYFDYGPLKISLRPEFVYSRNRGFERSPFSPPSHLSEYATPMYSYDVVQRFGENPVSDFNIGQSSVELHYREFTAGFSNRNIWTGPAMQNPILFSNNAPGFLHGFVGTHRPVQTPIGNVEGKLLWGGLRESGYYDNRRGNNLRYINAVVISYNPSFIPGLHVGGTRFFMKLFPKDGLEFSDLFFIGNSVIKEDFQTEENITGDDDGYQIASAFARWEFPDAGFEVYGEYSRNDHFRDNRDLKVNPTHTRAYMLGGSKRWNPDFSGWITFNFELTQISSPRAYNKEGYYTNIAVRQGFTHQGQAMGSGTDSGSFSQRGKVQLYQSWGLVGLSFNRIDHHIDRLGIRFGRINNGQDGNREPFELHETEHRWGLHGLFFLPHHLELQATIYQSRFFNRYNLHGNNVSNTNIELTLRVQMPGFRR